MLLNAKWVPKTDVQSSPASGPRCRFAALASQPDIRVHGLRYLELGGSALSSPSHSAVASWARNPMPSRQRYRSYLRLYEPRTSKHARRRSGYFFGWPRPNTPRTLYKTPGAFKRTPAAPRSISILRMLSTVSAGLSTAENFYVCVFGPSGICELPARARAERLKLDKNYYSQHLLFWQRPMQGSDVVRRRILRRISV